MVCIKKHNYQYLEKHSMIERGFKLLILSLVVLTMLPVHIYLIKPAITTSDIEYVCKSDFQQLECTLGTKHKSLFTLQ